MGRENLSSLVESLAEMPGIGTKTAERLAFYILNLPKEKVIKLINTISEVKESVKTCSICYNISFGGDVCEVCKSEDRDRTILCIVEYSKDLWAIERTKSYKGLYHVLGGHLSPLEGIGPQHLTISKLKDRVSKENLKEIIIGTNPTTEGEATAFWLQKFLGGISPHIKITRIAKGIPTGSNIEYANKLTLADSISGRREF